MGKTERALEQRQQQRLLEMHLQRIWEKGIIPGSPVIDIFGPIDIWQLKIGDVLFFLNPITKQWMFLDPLHDQWVKTGIGIGMGTIYTMGNQIFLEKKKNIDNNSATTIPANR